MNAFEVVMVVKEEEDFRWNVPKEVDETKEFHGHADERPLEKDQQDSTKEAGYPCTRWYQ